MAYLASGLKWAETAVKSIFRRTRIKTTIFYPQ